MTDPNEGISDLQMISEPDRWPHAVLLPLKRYTEAGKMPQSGFVIQQSVRIPVPAPDPVVYTGNIWDEKLSLGERQEYESLEAIVADGWVVD